MVTGKSGIFPSNYVRENVSSVGPSTAGQSTATQSEMVRATFDYDAMEEGELSFKEGKSEYEDTLKWKGML
jgi:hypothetical protein